MNTIQIGGRLKDSRGTVWEEGKDCLKLVYDLQLIVLIRNLVELQEAA
jgi:hypothetical protein